MTLAEALDHPDVLGPYFTGPSWDAWRAFCRALMALPMDEAQRATYTAATGRMDVAAAPYREAYAIVGRRSGKSRTAAAIAAYMAALAPTDRLAPGETGHVIVVAVDRAQAGVVFGYVKAMFSAQALAPLVVRETADTLELRHGVKVQVMTSSFRSIRGRTVLAAVVDELAYLRSEESAMPDVELLRALRPATMTTGGLILGISSPWARRGALWTAYERHHAKPGADVLVWQSDSRTMNPTLDVALVDAAVADDPEAGASEWSGLFRSDLESYVSLDVLDAVTDAGMHERPPMAGVVYHGFVDVAAGTGRDSFVAAVAHQDADGIAVLDAVLEVRPRFDPMAVTAEVAAWLGRYGVARVQSDAYAGGWVVEAFQRHGVAVLQDAPPKSALYLSALPFLTSGTVRLLDDDRLRRQLVGLERRRRSGGRDVVDHGPGGFDDRANACVGVILLAAEAGAVGVPVLTRSAPRLRLDGSGWDYHLDRERMPR